MLNEDLTECSAEEAVKAAIANRVLFKRAAARLRDLPASEGAARCLIDAYKAGLAPPWLTACLLRYTKHPVGYAVTKEILVAHPGMSAESYAAIAMVAIAGHNAIEDLKILLFESDHLRTRKGAAWGLTTCRDPKILGLFAEAVRARRIPTTYFAHAVAKLEPSDSVLEEWLSDTDDRVRRFAVRVVEWLLLGKSECHPSMRVAKLAAAVAGTTLPRFQRRV